MGNDDLFNKRRVERKIRQINVLKQKSSNWLIVCEGKKTEPNYFKAAIEDINKTLEEPYRLKVDIVGKGRNTTSLVDSVDGLFNDISSYKLSKINYDTTFVVFDKDDFTDDMFDEAIKRCKQKGYIPLWSNQAIEFWFLLHFYYIDSKMNRSLYAKKLNGFFKKRGLAYSYKKNDKNLYAHLVKYGSLEMARKNALKIYNLHINDRPSQSESCTTVYNFFDVVDERLKELE